MCGIAGTVNWGGRDQLARMAEVQLHRGPDDGGLWEHRTPDGACVGLASRRLAILDLSAAGQQPMSNQAGTLWITYNGEIYNHRELRQELEAQGQVFRSRTDTEVLLYLYERLGPACLNRLNGMFAFALCDLRGATPKLFLARDHFGVKPLYYICRGRRLAFASEMKALLQLPEVQVEFDWEGLNQYLTFLWVPDPKTVVRDVLKLPAGHYAEFADGELRITQYWDLSFPARNASRAHSEAELVEELRGRLQRSVQSQLVSDVPVGAFLSSGMDSGSIVASFPESSRPTRTYTISFPPKHLAGERTLDDPRIARQVAARFGCEHHEIEVQPDVAELLPQLTWHMDEPTADPAIIAAYLVCREARKQVTVLLSGIGGDELFAGYRKYYAHYWAEAYCRLPAAMRAGIGEFARRIPAGNRLKGWARLARKMTRSSALPGPARFLMNATYLDQRDKQWLCQPELLEKITPYDPWRAHSAYFERVQHADFLNQMLYLDSKAFMVSLNLNYNDKMSMASSLEVRVPFLDRELAEFAAQLAPSLKLKGFFYPQTKYLLRKAMRGILPDSVLRHPKAGFGAPLDYWLRHDLRGLVDQLLSPGQVARRGLFRPQAVRAMVEQHRARQQDWSMQIWQLLTLELWMAAFMDRKAELPRPRAEALAYE